MINFQIVADSSTSWYRCKPQVKFLKGLSRLFNAFLLSLFKLFNVGCILMLLLGLYAVLGVELFAKVSRSSLLAFILGAGLVVGSQAAGDLWPISDNAIAQLASSIAESTAAAPGVESDAAIKGATK